MIRFSVAPEEAGLRLDAVVASRASVPRARAADAVRNGAITVDGARAKPALRVAPGAVIAGVVEVPTTDAPAGEAIPVTIRYEDERVLVVSKPAGLVVHPAGGHPGGTLVNALLGLGVPLAGADPARPGIVHRLDKDTSGLLLVAKDDAAREHLMEALRRREVERTYLALVRGRPAASGTIDAPVGRHPTRRTLMAVVDGGRPAVTHFRTLATTARVALLEARLDTGRTHQIRVHLAHVGHPVAGDRTYGGGSAGAELGLDRPFLHSLRLAFPHPDDGRTVVVEDDLPPDLRAVLERAGLKAG